MKFRKKPVVIEAFQWTGQNLTEANNFIPSTQWSLHQNDSIGIFTLEGVMVARPFDWIIKGIKGEFYPCKPDIFEATYELAEPTAERWKPLNRAERQAAFQKRKENK